MGDAIRPGYPRPIADEPTRQMSPESSAPELDVPSLPDDSTDEPPAPEAKESREIRGPELAFDLRLPSNIGGGRFMPEEAIVYKKDDAGLTMLKDGSPVIESITYLHPRLDFSEPPTHEFFRSLEEFSPFHARSLMSEVHYPTGDTPELVDFPIPWQVRLHDRLFTD